MDTIQGVNYANQISYILKNKRVFLQLKEELGTIPRFFYYFDV